MLVQQCCSLAQTIASRNQSCIHTFLSFVQNVVEHHGAKAEVGPNIDNDSTVIRGMIKELMLRSYKSVMSISAAHEKSVSSTPQDNEGSPEIISPMFKTLTACVSECPIFLFSVSRDGQPAGELLVSSVHATPGTLGVAEVEVASSAVDFLNVLVSIQY